METALGCSLFNTAVGLSRQCDEPPEGPLKRTERPVTPRKCGVRLTVRSIELTVSRDKLENELVRPWEEAYGFMEARIKPWRGSVRLTAARVSLIGRSVGL